MNQPTLQWLPSLFAANPLHLGEGLRRICDAKMQHIHLDIMDGHFVPNISFGPELIQAVKEEAPLLFRSVHLMLSHPEDFIQKCIQNGAQRIFIHCEIDQHAFQRSLAILQASGISWGIAINPETPEDALSEFLPENIPLKHLLVMSVHPGFSGQLFIQSTYKKVEVLHQQFPQALICVDGGVNKTIAMRLHDCGANAFVLGSSFFSNKVH